MLYYIKLYIFIIYLFIFFIIILYYIFSSFARSFPLAPLQCDVADRRQVAAQESKRGSYRGKRQQQQRRSSFLKPTLGAIGKKANLMSVLCVCLWKGRRRRSRFVALQVAGIAQDIPRYTKLAFGMATGIAADNISPLPVEESGSKTLCVELKAKLGRGGGGGGGGGGEEVEGE